MTRRERSVVSASDVHAYRKDGAVMLKGVLGQRWIDTLNAGIDRNIANPGRNFVDFTAPGTKGRCVKDYWAWPTIPEYQEFFFDSPMAEIAGQLMGADEVCFLEDQFFEKAAGAATRSPWHHDQPYYEIGGRFCITWIPLDPVSRESSLEIVAGSHLWGELYTPPNFSEKGTASYYVDAATSPLRPVPDIEAQRASLSILSWEMVPGDVLVFGPRTLHANAGNPSLHRARRATFRWAAEDAMYDKGVFPWASLNGGERMRKGDRLHGPDFPLLWKRATGMLGRSLSELLMKQR
jgi:ectoine hydroxylase-related dioxygenase (phytanoyl-CoA dioxygenase family)